MQLAFCDYYLTFGNFRSKPRALFLYPVAPAGLTRPRQFRATRPTLSREWKERWAEGKHFRTRRDEWSQNGRGWVTEFPADFFGRVRGGGGNRQGILSPTFGATVGLNVGPSQCRTLMAPDGKMFQG